MTMQEAIHSTVNQPVLSLLFLILTVQLALVLALIREHRSGKVCVLATVCFLITAAVFYMPMLEIFWDHDDPRGLWPVPRLLAAFRAAPLGWMLAFEALAALAAALGVVEHVRYRREYPTFGTIKQTMDLLPAGLAFGLEDGTVLLVNIAMNSLAQAITGSPLKNLGFFREAARAGQMTLPDGSGVWQLSADTAEEQNRRFIQLSATEITEQARIARELAEKNGKLRELHMRLNIYNRQAERIIIAQELLSARMAVHSAVGNVLLEGRHYLHDPSSFEEEALLHALKNTNTYLLREYEQDDTERDPLTDALDMARAIGVDVSFTGRIPGEETHRRVLAAAITECAANTVKHAGGDRLLVTLRDKDGEHRIVLEGNGVQPRETVRASGGLASLRAIVENEHGTMETPLLPAYRVEIRLPGFKK